MTENQHRERHKKLHESLDELLADYLEHTGKMVGAIVFWEFLGWSHRQTLEPTPLHGKDHDPKPNANPKP